MAILATAVSFIVSTRAIHYFGDESTNGQKVPASDHRRQVSVGWGYNSPLLDPVRMNSAEED